MVAGVVGVAGAHVPLTVVPERKRETVPAITLHRRMVVRIVQVQTLTRNLATIFPVALPMAAVMAADGRNSFLADEVKKGRVSAGV
jgi:hypothetical protein